MPGSRRPFGIPLPLLLGCALLAAGCGSEDEYTSVLDDETFETIDEPIDPIPADPPARRPRILTVFGTVRDAMGLPQSEARVELLRRPPIGEDARDPDGLKVRASTTTDAEGAWRIRAEVSGPMLLRVTRGNVTLTRQRAVPWAGGRVDIRGESQTATAVGVYTPEGRPIKDPWIAYVAHDPAGARLPMAIGEVSSRHDVPLFAFGLPPGAGEFLVRAPGRAMVRRPAVITLDTEDSATAITLPRAHAVNGLVLRAEDGRPLANVPVWIREPRLGGLVERRVRTTVEGTFDAAVSAEPGTVVDILVRAAGYGPTYRRLTVSPENEDEVVLRLAAAERVQGRVLDPSGAPVRGATLQWLDGFPLADWHPDQGGPPRLVRTDEQGRFAIPWPAGEPGPYARVLLAAAETGGYVTARVTEPTGSRRLRLVLGGAARVAGHVRTYKNEPVAGAAVRLERVDPAFTAPGGGPPWPHVAQALRAHLPRMQRVATDEQGAFAFPGVPQGTWRLSVRFGDQELVDAARIHVQRGAKVGDVDVRFPHGTLDLRLHAIAEKMFAGALGGRTRQTQSRVLQGYVRLQAARGERGASWSMRVPLPADGRVVVPGLVDMPYHVQVVAAGHLLGSAPAVSPNRGEIRVALEPTPGLQITTRHDPSVLLREPALVVLRPAPTDYGHDRGRPITIGERPFVEAPDGSLTGALALASRHQQSELLMRSPAGRYVLSSVPRGSYDVALFTLDGRAATSALSVDLPTRTMVHAGPLSLVAVAGFRGRLVSGLGADEGPVSGARCELRPARRSVILAHGRVRVRSDSNGRFAFTGLMQGNYALTVELPGGLLWEQRIDVAPGSDNFLVMVVREPGSLEVHVEDGDKSPLAGAHVQLLTEHGLQVGPRPTGRTDDDGVLRVAALAPGAYTVIVRYAGMAAPAELPKVVVETGAQEKLWVTMTTAPARGR